MCMTTTTTSAAQLHTSSVYAITAGSVGAAPLSDSRWSTSACSFAASCAASAAVVISSTCGRERQGEHTFEQGKVSLCVDSTASLLACSCWLAPQGSTCCRVRLLRTAVSTTTTRRRRRLLVRTLPKKEQQPPSLDMTPMAGGAHRASPAGNALAKAHDWANRQRGKASACVH